MNKAIFLDRDGTIIKDKNYSFNPKSIEFIEGVIPSLLKLQNSGYLLIIITNQSGIARGLFSEAELKVFNDTLLYLLKENGIAVTAIYYCPHHPQGVVPQYAIECSCRKPGVKMFLDAVSEYNIDLAQSYAIGDNERDCAICFVSDCRGCLVNKNKASSNRLIKSFQTFEKCVDYILGEAE